MLEVGLSAMLTRMSWPVEMPPKFRPRCSREIPGRQLVAVLGALLLDRGEAGADLHAFTALMPIIAEAMSESSLP